jgi:uncharacterized protein YoxC
MYLFLLLQRLTNDTQRLTNDTQRLTNDTQRLTNDTQHLTNDTQRLTNDTHVCKTLVRIKCTHSFSNLVTYVVILLVLL